MSQPIRLPEGIHQCADSGEYRGQCKASDLNHGYSAEDLKGIPPRYKRAIAEGSDLLKPPDDQIIAVSCICEGIVCPQCKKGRMHRPISNRYDPANPHFWAAAACFEQGRAEEDPSAKLAWFGRTQQELIKALDAGPDDWDAKYNLELALRKLKEQQKQKQSQGGNQSDEQKKDQTRNQQNSKDAQNRPPSKGDSPPQDPTAGQSKPADPQATQGDRSEGAYSRERALQILDALQNQELAEQRKLLEQRARRKAAGKDW